MSEPTHSDQAILNELTDLETHDVLAKIPDKVKMYRSLSMGAELTGLPEKEAARVRLLLRLGGLIADELEEAQAVPAFEGFYRSICEQIRMNQELVTDTSMKLNELTRARTNQLLMRG